MKTIWMMNHYAVPPELGPLTRHYKLAEKLIHRGYNVKVFGASTLHYLKRNIISGNEKYKEIQYRHVPFVFIRTINYENNGKKRILSMVQYALGLLTVTKKLNAEKPDVIYASSAHPLTWLSGYLLSKRYKAKFIAETRDLWPESLVKLGEIGANSLPAKILYKLEKFIYKHADQLVFTFPGGGDYAKKWAIEDSKVYNINNGVDLQDFASKKDRPNEWVKILKSDDYFKVVYTGSIGMPNAVHTLIEAARVIESLNENKIKIYIFGDGTERERLESYIAEHKIKSVTMMGRVDKEMIPSIITHSDLNVITGLKTDLYQYGLSLNKMFEYFAAGKPIVSNIECGYDLLEKYLCGVTVKGENAEALASKIIEFSKMNVEEYTGYCKNALEAAKDFDFDILTDKLEHILNA